MTPIEVRIDIDEQIRDAWHATARLERLDASELRKLWKEHRPGKPWPGLSKAPGKLAVTLGAKGIDP